MFYFVGEFNFITKLLCWCHRDSTLLMVCLNALVNNVVHWNALNHVFQAKGGHSFIVIASSLKKLLQDIDNFVHTGTIELGWWMFIHIHYFYGVWNCKCSYRKGDKIWMLPCNYHLTRNVYNLFAVYVTMYCFGHCSIKLIY